MNLFLSVTRQCAVIALANLAVSVQAGHAPHPTSQDWMHHYYENPNPDLFVSSVFELSRTRHFDQPGYISLGLGFFATLFREHPDYIDEWMKYSRLLPEQERRLMISALWCAGHPKGEEYLRFYAEQVVGEKLANQLLSTLQGERSFDRPDISSRRSLYLKWGVFLASGDPDVLRSILAALTDLEDLTARDRWWLACAAAEHETVLALCEAELNRADTPLRDALQLVLDAREVRPTG